MTAQPATTTRLTPLQRSALRFLSVEDRYLAYGEIYTVERRADGSIGIHPTCAMVMPPVARELNNRRLISWRRVEYTTGDGEPVYIVGFRITEAGRDALQAVTR